MGDDAQRDRRGHGSDDVRRPEGWRAATVAQRDEVSTIDARPRGPNQPMNATVGPRNRVPRSAMYGTIRITVNDRTA